MDPGVGRLRRRIRLLCGVWFLAGAGVALAADAWLGRDGDQPLQHPGHEDYVQRIATDYGLGPERQRLLRMVLLDQEQERLRVLRAADEQLPESVRAALEEVDREADQRIRTLLPPDERARYTAAGAGPGQPR